MPLEDPNVIDMGVTPVPGELVLVITDAGITSDPEERLKKFKAKLETYVGYVSGECFADDHALLMTIPKSTVRT